MRRSSSSYGFNGVLMHFTLSLNLGVNLSCCVGAITLTYQWV